MEALKDLFIFIRGPLIVANFGVEYILPTFAALLTSSALDIGRSLVPLCNSKFLDPLYEFLVFIGVPLSLLETGRDDFVPTMNSLYGSSPWYPFCN